MFFYKKDHHIIPYQKEINKIHDYHTNLATMSREELITLTQNLKTELIKTEERKIRAYAIIHEVIKRVLGMTPYDVQLSGGIALREGNVAQMKTGEGKTITALFPAFWGYIANLQTYVITVNEYLAERDHEQAQTVFTYLDIEVGLISDNMDMFTKKSNYAKPIVYVTNSEFAFDYLRDNVAPDKELFMQGEFDFAVIDEADLVLIDEAKNPVIISSSSSENVSNMLKAKEFVQILKEDDYEIDDELFIPYLSEKGYDTAKDYFGYELTDNHNMFHAVRQSLMAYYKFKRDVDYIVRDGEVQIVDKFTGRVLSGRRFQQGLHQAIEAKENVEIKPENIAVATVTYQNLFRKFKLLSGMTGTGIESKKEFEEIYRMDVKVIPTNKPIQRIDHDDVMFQTKIEKYNYLVQLIKEKHKKGQPVLIGTISVQESEETSSLLEKANIPFQLLNAKNDKEEAEIIENAGEKGVITIATNMAGRGTDIKLTDEIEALGGLYLLGVSRNESKRIDRQLIGRSGRQGQKGESQFLTSIEDEFLINYPTNKFKKFIKKNNEYPVTKDIVTKMVDEIQDVMDSQGVSVRKFQFQMDEILHYQREFVYGIRKGILVDGLSLEKVKEKIEQLSTHFLSSYNNGSPKYMDWNKEDLEKNIKEKFFTSISLKDKDEADIDTKKYKILFEKEIRRFLEKVEEKVDKEEIEQLVKSVSVQIIDRHWMIFLEELDQYKTGFGLQSMGEQDPIRKFSMDVDAIFKDIMAEAWVDFFSQLFKEADVLLTMASHSFFTVFPMKNTYLFKFPLPKREGAQQVRSVLYGEQNIVDEFTLVGTNEVIINIPYMLNPGKYVLRNFVDGTEINRIGFKVIHEKVEEITEDTPALYFRLPIEDMHPVEDSTFQASLIHVVSKNTFAFDVPSTNEWVNIEKPDEQNWMLGRYVITVSGANLPLYHKEYIVHPKEKKENPKNEMSEIQMT